MTQSGTTIAKNTVISPNFMVWEFCGKAKFRIVSGDSPETISCEIAHYGKSLIAIFWKSFGSTNFFFSFLQENWALGYHSMEFRHFLNIF